MNLTDNVIYYLSRIDIDLYGVSGGFKEVRNEFTTDVETKDYTGTITNHNLHIYFDLEPPVHCSLDQSCGEDTFDFPIYVNPDVSKVSQIISFVCTKLI